MLLRDIGCDIFRSISSGVFGGNLADICSHIACCVHKFLSNNCRSGLVDCGVRGSVLYGRVISRDILGDVGLYLSFGGHIRFHSLGNIFADVGLDSHVFGIVRRLLDSMSGILG